MKTPRMGRDWSQLAELAGKLASGERTLTDAEASWLGGLFADLQEGKDVQARFWQAVTGAKRKDERDFWIAANAAQLRAVHHPDPWGETARLWGLDPSKADDLRRAMQRKKLKPRAYPAVMIAYHRARLLNDK